MDIPQDWTNVDELIMDMMQTFPSLFPSRIECWMHLFTSYGAGYEWDLETGQLYYPYKEHIASVPDTPILETLQDRDTDSEPLVFANKRTNLLRQHTWDNIRTVVQDYHHSTTERHITSISCLSWSDPESKYYHPALMQQACINKDKIAKEWRYEIAAFCKWIKGETYRFCYSPSKERKGVIPDKDIIAMLEKSDIRKIYEMKTAFIAAIKVLENIFTEGEKKRHETNRQKMIKDIKDIVARS